MYTYSVVIPTYNCKKTICRAIDSCLSANYAGIEIIVVDDGSSDETLEVLKKYSNVDSVKVVKHESNAGILKARISGMAEATGQRIFFLDADDYVRVDIFERLNDIKDDVDSILFQLELNSNKKHLPYMNESGIKKEKLSAYYLENFYLFEWTCGGRAYKTSTIKRGLQDLEFLQEKVCLAEDGLLFSAVFPYINSFALLKEALYFYQDNNDDDKGYIHKNESYELQLAELRRIEAIVMDLFSRRLPYNEENSLMEKAILMHFKRKKFVAMNRLGLISFRQMVGEFLGEYKELLGYKQVIKFISFEALKRLKLI